MTITDAQMIHTLIALHLTVVVHQLILRSGYQGMSNWWTYPEGWSNWEILVIICNFESSVNIQIAEWSCVIPELYNCNTRGVTDTLGSYYFVNL